MQNQMRTYQVIAVSPGIAIGKVRKLRSFNRFQAPELRKIEEGEVKDNIELFEQAIKITAKQITELKRKLPEELKEQAADIFDAHMLILKDPVLHDSIIKTISNEFISVECAIYQVASQFVSGLEAVNDDYLRERASDIRDVMNRLIGNLDGDDDEKAVNFEVKRIMIAENLTPSETARLDPERVLGFALESGSMTSHTAILARSLHIPAVVGIPTELLEELGVNDKVIIDGFSGVMIVNPDARTEETYRLKKDSAGNLISQLQKEKTLHPETTDGFMIPLLANVDRPGGTELKDFGAAGVGLFRTEYLFMSRTQLPDEEEQFETYKALLIGCDDAPVTIRTLDVGGDKYNSTIYRSNEENPFLGLRGIRLCLNERKDIFKVQLRALLRAGVYGNLKVLLPMVSLLEEITETRSLIDNLQQELKKEGKDFVNKLNIGIMIETPAAALMASKLAPHVDFFSIGTNDLIQYTMAADRGNDKVANLQHPSHPAILELIRFSVIAAERNGISLSVCGQSASDVCMIPLLVGLGVNELSMEVESIGVVRRIIRSISIHDAKELARKALNASSAQEAISFSRELLLKYSPEVMKMSS